MKKYHAVGLAQTRGWLLAASCLVVSACAEPTPPLIPAEVGLDGALRFARADDFFRAIDAISEMDGATLDGWERDVEFLSMRRAALEAERLLAPAVGAERAQLLADYADVLDPLQAEPTRRVRASGYASLVDRRGIFYVNGVLHHVSGTRISTALDGKLETLTNRIAGDVSDESGVEYMASGESADATSSSACGALFGGQVTTGDRRQKYETRLVNYSVRDQIGNWQYRYRIEWEFWGYKKVLWWWEAYPTKYQVYNVGYDLDVLNVTGFDGVKHQYDYERINFSFPFHELQTEGANVFTINWMGDSVQNVRAADIRAPFFYKFHEETTSRGTYPTRGVMECGFCGDGVCQPEVNESVSSCRADCGTCGDGVCFGSENAGNCYSDCHCGNGVCDAGETPSTCSADCRADQCPMPDGAPSNQWVPICPV
jgi:hypothetical protein